MSVIAEEAIVASCIESAVAFDMVAGKLTRADFTDARMGLLFQVMAEFRQSGRIPDPITMASAVEQSESWSMTGGGDAAMYLSALGDMSSSFMALSTYIEIVQSATVSRGLMDAVRYIAELAKDKTLSPDQKISLAQGFIPVFENDSVGGFVSYAAAAQLTLEDIGKRVDGTPIGVPTGLANLDAMINGFEPGTLTIVAGRPSHGKSIYALQFAHALSAQGMMLVFSVEMKTANLAERGMSALGMVDFGDMRAAKLDNHQYAGMSHAIVQMKKMNLWIDDRANISVDQVCTRARIMARQAGKAGLAGIAVDYLTLLSGVGDNRTERTGYVSRMLKALAKELHVPVIAVAQLNRGVDSRTDKRPNISDLRDSGEIEQDADVIMFTYLDEKYNKDDENNKGVAELIIAKQRNGPTGTIYNEFQGRYQRFIPLEGGKPAEVAKPVKSKMSLAVREDIY